MWTEEGHGPWPTSNSFICIVKKKEEYIEFNVYAQELLEVTKKENLVLNTAETTACTWMVLLGAALN